MANQPYSNFVIEDMLENILTTKVDLNNYLTADRQLAEDAGMKKTVHRYKATGSVQDLTQGNGNSTSIEVGRADKDYTVSVTQGRFIYYDEEAMKDPMIVDAGVKGLADTMVNDFTTKAIGEMKDATKTIECDFTTTSTDYFFGKVVDALAKFGEEEEGLTLLVHPNQQAYIRKQLADNLKYSEGFARTGYIGSVCGIPVVVSKAVPDKVAFIVNRKAVRLFLKKESEAEQERDANLRKNTVYLRKVALVALFDESKLAKLAVAQSTACAITTYTKAAKTIAGTCGTDCNLVRVTDGDGIVYDVVPTNGSWTMTAAENLTAGDKINAIAYAPTKAEKAATEVTVAS